MALVTLQEASKWATNYLEREVSPTNIAYLIQYGKVEKYEECGAACVDLDDLKSYYQSWIGQREQAWKQTLGKDLNWALSFDHLRERDTTKHVHRLHPYKGKFIPQLVQYFIDAHTDEYKKDVYFKAGDILLDPFSGSGTTLVQANEMGMHGIGIDVSQFNCMISRVKLDRHDFASLQQAIERIRRALEVYEHDSHVKAFEAELTEKLSAFNAEHFPSPDFKRRVAQKKVDESRYSKEKHKQFLRVYSALLKKYAIRLQQDTKETFLDKWYCDSVRKEINIAFERVKGIRESKTKQALAVVLSRTIRSCRATTHSDLATLKQPQHTTYYCWKHKKICKPLYSIKYWFNRYAHDTLTRLKVFERLRSTAHFAVISADSQNLDLFAGLKKHNKALHDLVRKQKIKGIFSSPPYVGQIDYHEQHAYAYDLFGFKRKDELEIGPLCKGQGAQARRSYVDGVSNVLLNSKQYLADDFDVFLVANDKHNLYPAIAKQSGMQVVNTFKRPVLNRTERSKSPYSEIIFHLKAQ